MTIAGASLAGVNLASGQLKAVGGRAAPITVGQLLAQIPLSSFRRDKIPFAISHRNFFQGSPQQLQQLKVQRQLQLFQKQSVGGSQRVALQPVAGGKVSLRSFDGAVTDPILAGVAGTADSAGPGGREGFAGNGDCAAAATDCQVCRWWWARPAYTAGKSSIWLDAELELLFPSDHLACGACQARGSRSNSSGASSSCVRCCCKAGSTDHTGAFTDPHFPHTPPLHHHDCPHITNTTTRW